MDTNIQYFQKGHNRHIKTIFSPQDDFSIQENATPSYVRLSEGGMKPFILELLPPEHDSDFLIACGPAHEFMSIKELSRLLKDLQKPPVESKRFKNEKGTVTFYSIEERLKTRIDRVPLTHYFRVKSEWMNMTIPMWHKICLHVHAFVELKSS